MHAENQEHAFTTLFDLVMSLTDEQMYFLSQKLYSDRKPRAYQKLGNGPGVGKYSDPVQHKICKCPAVARGAGKGWAQLELTDAYTCFVSRFCERSIIVPSLLLFMCRNLLCQEFGKTRFPLSAHSHTVDTKHETMKSVNSIV